MLRKFWIFVGIVVALIALWTLFTLTWSYSAGERAGYVQKFSKKGWICKTWEGELALVSLPGSTAEKFFFTVRRAGMVAARRSAALRLTRISLSHPRSSGIPTFLTRVPCPSPRWLWKESPAGPPPPAP